MDASQVAPHGARPGDPADSRQKRIDAAAVEFEAMFLGTMVNEMMRDAMPKTMNGGFGEEMFRGMMGDAVGRQLAEQGGIGLGDEIRRSLMESME